MARAPVQQVVDRLRKAVEVEQMPDGVLLDGFVGTRNEAAFAELVRRHGPMVWGVCCRLLSHPQDAEDCYQATFLVLVRKADTVRPRSRVGAWLHGVAYHTALKARDLAAKRGQMEQQVERLPEPMPPKDTTGDLRQFIDRGLSEVPEKYRLAIVLCDLEGRPLKEVAQELGAPIGTVAGWLARGRDLLARRLVKHGAPAGAAAMTAVLAEKAASAPPALASASATALALADATIRTLFLVKLKSWLVAAAALLVLTLGLGGTLYQVLARDRPAIHFDERPDDARDKLAEAEPDSLRPLRFGWNAGESYVYAVRIEVKLASGTAVYTSFNNYGVATVDARSWQRQRDKLIAQAETGADKSPCLLLQSRLSNTEHKNSDRSESQVPMVLGNLALLTVLPDAAAGDSPWQATTDCVVNDGASPRPVVGKLPRRIPGPAGRDAGAPAKETSIFTIAKRSGDLVTIDKKYLLRSQQEENGLPSLEFQAEGSITFDAKIGLTRGMELNGVVRGASRPAVPIRVSYRLLEGEERDEAIKAIQDSQPKEEPQSTAIELLSTGATKGPEWVDDLAKMHFPEGPVAGRILGHDFKLDAAKLEPSGALTLRQGDETLPTAVMVIFLKPGQAIEGTTYEIHKDTPLAQRLPIHVRCATPGQNQPMASVFVLNYAMKLEFGKAKDGMVPARIYVCLPDQAKSVIAGSFMLQLK